LEKEQAFALLEHRSSEALGSPSASPMTPSPAAQCKADTHGDTRVCAITAVYVGLNSQMQRELQAQQNWPSSAPAGQMQWICGKRCWL